MRRRFKTRGLNKNELYTEMQRRVNSLILDLKNQTFESLICLPEYAHQDVEFSGWTFAIGVYRETIDEDTVQIFVQAGRMGHLGFYALRVDGFRKTSSGEFVAVPQDVMYDYD